MLSHTKAQATIIHNTHTHTHTRVSACVCVCVAQAEAARKESRNRLEAARGKKNMLSHANHKSQIGNAIISVHTRIDICTHTHTQAHTRRDTHLYLLVSGLA